MGVAEPEREATGNRASRGRHPLSRWRRRRRRTARDKNRAGISAGVGLIWPGEVAVALGWPLPSASRQPWDSAGYSSPDGLSGGRSGRLAHAVMRVG